MNGHDQTKRRTTKAGRSYHLDRLLSSRSGLAVTEKEQIFEHVAARVVRAERARAHPRWLAWASGALAGVAALVLAFVWFVARDPGPDAGPRERWAVKGAPEPAPGGVEVYCRAPGSAESDAGAPGVCRRGDKLYFRVDPGEEKGFLSLVAVGPGEAALWYFPSDTTPSLPLAEVWEGGIVQRAVIVGDEHTPGDYVIYGVLSARPLDKEQVRRAVEEPAQRAQAGTRVFTMDLRIMP